MDVQATVPEVHSLDEQLGNALLLCREQLLPDIGNPSHRHHHLVFLKIGSGTVLQA